MRGTRRAIRDGHFRLGNIPAYAENTLSIVSAKDDSRDHPRVCGEHHEPVENTLLNAGSSPRMRGTHGNAATTVAPNGIIPAYAGNTD